MTRLEFSLNFDGGAQPNPGVGGCGWVIKNTQSKNIVASGGKRVVIDGLTNVTNNQAEYCGLIDGLKECQRRSIRCLEVLGDSKLVINHVTGVWQIQKEGEHLRPLVNEVFQLMSGFTEIQFRHVARDKNKEADKIANDFIKQAIDNRRAVATGQDYSTAWLAALKDNIGHVEYHQLMLETLDSIDDEFHKLPPTIPPPPVPAPQSNPDVHTQTYTNTSTYGRTGEGTPSVPSVSLSNAFSALTMDDDDDGPQIPLTRETLQAASAAAAGRGNQRNGGRGGRGGKGGRGGGPGLIPTANVNAAITTGTSHQVRYLITRAECGLAEAIRLSTAAHVSRKDYGTVATLWQEAYDILNATFQNANGWQAILLNYAESNGSFANALFLDDHNIPALQELMNSLDIVRYDTTIGRDAAVKTLEFQLRKVNNKLNPLRKDRDEIKSNWGEKRWNNNPQPKMDYAERMRMLADEKAALERAIAVISVLQLR